MVRSISSAGLGLMIIVPLWIVLTLAVSMTVLLKILFAPSRVKVTERPLDDLISNHAACFEQDLRQS